jgi:hypothetical protein
MFQQRLLSIVRGIRLLEEEGYSADYDEFTNAATAICCHHADWESAQYWATKTYESRVAEFGIDSQSAIQVKGQFLDPKTHAEAGIGQIFKSTIRL